jgi:putative nucleotidyltransferase with HDIG domain
MRFELPPEVVEIINKFVDADFEIYVVGGAVRDLLMDKLVVDWDFTTNATPEQIQSVLPESFYENKFGTVGIKPKNPDFKPHEITTYRTEHGYSDKRRPDKVVWGTTLLEDLERRDFTVNAIALHYAQGKPFDHAQGKPSDYELIDPFGGQEDIENKLIKAVGDPVGRFDEDALRMMRAIRIAAELGFQIEQKTFEAIKMHASSINQIAMERVRDEFLKILISPNPLEGIMMLRSSGLLNEILPELARAFGVEQKSPGRHHIHDVGTHCLLSLKHCQSEDPITRFATLIHDIGKPSTFRERDGVITFYNHEMEGAKIAKQIARRFKLSKEETEKLYKLVRWHQFTVDERQTDKAIRRFIRNVGLDLVEEMLTLRVGDRLGGGARETSWRLEEFKERLVEVQKQPFTVHDLKIKGDDVMRELDLKPGPQVGEVLNKLFDDVIEKRVENEREALLLKVKELTN